VLGRERCFDRPRGRTGERIGHLGGDAEGSSPDRFLRDNGDRDRANGDKAALVGELAQIALDPRLQAGPVAVKLRVIGRVQRDREGVRHLDAVRADEAVALHRAGRRLRQLDRLEAMPEKRAGAAFNRTLKPALEMTEQTCHRRTAIELESNTARPAGCAASLSRPVGRA
jgi:hypothetical protein